MMLLFAVFFIALAGIGGLVLILARPNDSLPVNTCQIGQKKFSVEVASTIATRMRGLSYRQSLPSGSGMLFVFPTSNTGGFWMKDMNFALDLVWMKNGRVVGVERNIPPPLPGTPLYALPIYHPPESITHVLEVNAGEAADINVGDTYSCNEGTIPVE